MKINLEQELIRQNRKLATPKELLQVKEYDMHGELLKNDALSRVGLNKVLNNGASIKIKIEAAKSATQNFKQERVFHISQIKSVCNKYYLRFLPSKYYNGTIDNELPTKITNFEAAYNVKCSQENTMICAPMESFDLQERPKDPLFFYQINDQYFYLVHKWGNDLSASRYIYTLLSDGLFCWLITWMPFAGLMFLNFKAGLITTIGVFCITAFWFGLTAALESKPIRYVSKNKWRSTHSE